MEAIATPSRAVLRLVVIDPCLHDYHSLLDATCDDDVRLTLTTSGSNALRIAPSFSDALWLVCPQLPDMDGLDVLEMLRSLRTNLNALVIDSVYDQVRERRALQLRALQYVCKPFQPAWLDAWRREMAPTRASPSVAPVTLHNLDRVTFSRFGDSL
ncbi:MAG: response regulator [Planctomycetota bacterium]